MNSVCKSDWAGFDLGFALFASDSEKNAPVFDKESGDVKFLLQRMLWDSFRLGYKYNVLPIRHFLPHCKDRRSAALLPRNFPGNGRDKVSQVFSQSCLFIKQLKI